MWGGEVTETVKFNTFTPILHKARAFRGKGRSPLPCSSRGLIAALHVTAFLPVLTLGAMGKVSVWVHSLNTNFGIRKVRYLEECLILNIEINQLELVKALVCLIKPSPALVLDSGPKNYFVFFFK